MSKKKIWKNMLALLLSLMMLVGTVPVNAEPAYNEKISEKLQKDLAEMEDDDLIMIWIHVKTISEKELDALMLKETKYDPADFKVTHGTVADGLYLEARRDIRIRENKAATVAFCEKYLADNYISLKLETTGTIVAEVSKAEVLLFASLDEVEDMSSYKDIPEQTVFIYGDAVLSEERERVLRENYIALFDDPRRTPDEVIIDYYGTFSGCEIVCMSVWDQVDTTDMAEVVLGSYAFIFGSGSQSNRFYVHKDNKFIPITRAYSDGIITDEDVALLAKNYPPTYMIVDDEYYPVLYVKKENQIKEAYLERIKTQYSDVETQKLTVDDVDFLQYFGNFDGREVFLAYIKGWEKQDALAQDRIGGYVFEFSSTSLYPEHFLAWEEGSLLTVKEARDAGELSGDSIYKIALRSGNIPKISDLAYTDIDFKQDWYAMSAYKAYAMDVMTGMDEDTFGPYETLSRAHFVTMLYRLSTPYSMDYEAFDYPLGAARYIFPDVTLDTWYGAAVNWAAQNGIVTGYENGYFGPADPITREQMAVMLYRYAEYKGYDVTKLMSLNKFGDAKEVSSYAITPMSWCTGNKIITGNNGNLKPFSNTTRAEAAAMVTRFAEAFE